MTRAQPNRDCGWIRTAFALSVVVLVTFGCAGDDLGDSFLQRAKRDHRMAHGSVATAQIVDRANTHRIIFSSRGHLSHQNARMQSYPNGNEPLFKFVTLIDRNPTTDLAPSHTPSPTDAILGHLRRKEFDRALEQANNLIQANSKDPAGYNLQGAAYLGKNDYSNARKSFEKALNLQPDNSQALVNLAQLDLQQKDLANARKRYQAVLAKDPKNVLAMLGMAQVEGKNEKESIAWIEKAKSANPQAVAPRVFLGAYYLRTRNFAKALAELTEAQQYNPDEAPILDLLGQAQTADGQKSAAVLTYNKLVSVSPGSPVAHYRLANARINVDDISGGMESLKKALQLKPDYAEAVYELAALNVRANRHDEAIKLARQLQTLTPQSPVGFTIEGDVLSAQGQYLDAAKVYEKAFAIRQTGPIVVKLHATETKAGNTKEADAKLQQWLKDHPDDILVWRYAAAENLKAGRNKLAIEQYELILKKSPNDIPALNNLANLYHREKDPRALKLAENAYKLMPDSPSVSDTLGWILVEQGKTKRGLELVQKAAAKLPKNAEVRYHLAAALAKSGDKAKARKELETLLASDERFPQREAAQSLLKQL